MPVGTGNHDVGLDCTHARFSPPALALFTSPRALAQGIRYLDNEIATVALYESSSGVNLPLRVFGNPMTPDFLHSSYGFIYDAQSPGDAQRAWRNAPLPFHRSRVGVDYVLIHVTHGAPLGHLDYIPIPPLTGDMVQADVVQSTRPLLCVFGHYHISRGHERSQWKAPAEPVASRPTAFTSGAEDCRPNVGGLSTGEPGESTLFVNCAWMTHEKRAVERRNDPIVVLLRLPGKALSR